MVGTGKHTKHADLPETRQHLNLSEEELPLLAILLLRQRIQVSLQSCRDYLTYTRGVAVHVRLTRVCNCLLQSRVEHT